MPLKYKKILMKLIKTNNLFNIAFIIFNYSLNITSKSYVTVKHSLWISPPTLQWRGKGHLNGHPVYNVPASGSGWMSYNFTGQKYAKLALLLLGWEDHPGS